MPQLQGLTPYPKKSQAMAQAIRDYGTDFESKGCLKLRNAGWVFKPISTITVPDVIVLATKKKVERETMSNLPVLESSHCASPCRAVWDTADAMEGATRSDVIVKCIELGVATATAKTQYARWKKARNK